MTGATPRSCKTCGRWGRAEEENGGYRPCKWPRPLDMPFWASIGEGSDHDDWTAPGQGRTCPAWVAPEDMA